MLNSLLNAGMSIDSLILNVVIILGVVIAGALIFYFLCEGFASLTSKSKKSGGTPSKELNFGEKKPKIKEDVVLVSDFHLDAEAAIKESAVTKPAREEAFAMQDVVLLDEKKLEEVDDKKAAAEKAEIEGTASQEERENIERRAYLEKRRQELIKRMQAEMEKEPEEAKPVATEVEKEEDEEEEIETKKPVEVSKTVETGSLEEEKKALISEKEKYELMIKELEEAKKALAEQSKIVPAAPKAVATAPIVSKLSIEQLREKLEKAENRLKATEKEFKQCKKEYLPLHKVWSDYEKYTKKLRRKEALVANQKMELYGVNNYADIDEAKAQKLAEDLDHYDGLKLSVQHCEDVMKKNEARFPLLEKMYNVLKIRNDELKKDIDLYRAEIEKLESEQNNI